MKAEIKPGTSEIQVAAAGEHAVRSRGASGFGFSAIVGSGVRSNAVVPTASSKPLADGELVMIGLAPKVRGYGIHGTWDESTIGRQSSAGCVRMRNADVAEIFMLLPRGTPVTIVE